MEPNLCSNDSDDNKDAGDLSMIRVCRKLKRQDCEVCDFFQPSSIGSFETTPVCFSDDLVFAWLRDCIEVGAEHSLTDDAATDAAMGTPRPKSRPCQAHSHRTKKGDSRFIAGAAFKNKNVEAHDSNPWAWAYMLVAEVGTLRRR